MFRLFKKFMPETEAKWFVFEGDDGVLVNACPHDNSRPLTDPLLGSWLEQLEEEGYATTVEDGIFISWDTIYILMDHSEHGTAVSMLKLPATATIGLALHSKASLEDPSFSIAVGDWRVESKPVQDMVLHGAVLNHGHGRVMLPATTWSVVKQVKDFARRTDAQRIGQFHRLAWGQIRRAALAASANLDSFLFKTVILTPEKLAIGVRKAQVGDDTVIEVEPTFESAPADWIRSFDERAIVPDRYEIPTEDGIVQVLITPKVRTVLEEIKRLKDRRVAGARAQAFILNPYAALGEDANEVIDEQQFAEAREGAGLSYERFLPQFERDELGFPVKVGLLIETASANGPSFSEVVWLDDSILTKFVNALRAAIAKNYQLLGWQGYDLELQGDAQQHLMDLETALAERKRPQVLISYAQIYDLSHYASRVQEIGFEHPYFSPYIAKKKDEDGWFPENIINIITWVPEGESEPVAMPISPEALAELQQKVVAAKAAGKTEVSMPGLPKAIPIAEAERITETFSEVFEDAKQQTFDPEKPKQPPTKGQINQIKRKSPVIRPNIQNIDYAEQRGAALSATGRKPKLPSALRPEYALLPHQRDGVAWLQTLFEAQFNYNCRGALLADDMGLGKTLQLLTLMVWAIENYPDIDPMLVVAPVSLLENWKEEAGKFLSPGSVDILTAYGENLADLRVPRENIDQRLRDEDGLTKFLKPGWRGAARIVLTTYETLRDLEFSFASEHWSVMVCDEAQKIKNPAALVTRAAKKQHVAFKIACTGTPVENTLADLWCLFDYVQPGLLGALNDFGRRYRKPIEVRNDEERIRVEELRKLIAPQILRRTKSDVARDLPNKIVMDECRRLPLSVKQRELYSRAIELFNQRNDPGANVPFKNHLGLLHYLRLICTDPRRYGLDVFKPEELTDYRGRAPKLDWLLKELIDIRKKEEKVIIFCEFRNIQRLLQHYIKEVFGIRPDIINGDTAPSATHAQSRQKRIHAFQEKPGFGVIILSPVAVGFGVNIQAANHVVHYTRTWNPAKEDQATDRAYRIGQKKDVFVYYPVVTAEDFTTFDEKLDRLLEAKRQLAQDMLNGSGDLHPGEFNLDDVVPPSTPLNEEPVTLKTALSMNWEYFEGLVAILYANHGYHVFRTPSSKDNGVDVVALPKTKGPGKLIQAKSSSVESTTLDWDAVKEVVAGRAFYAKQFPMVDFELVCITNQRFDKQAHENAVLNKVELVEQPDLKKMLEKTQVTLIDVEKVLFTDWTMA